MKHEIRDTGDDHWMTGWPRWACTCGTTGASRTVPTKCPSDKGEAAPPPPTTQGEAKLLSRKRLDTIRRGVLSIYGERRAGEVVALLDHIDALEAATPPPATGLAPGLAKLRALGWSVAVHNDYKQNGEAMTFWLFTHPSGRWIKGEGRTDEEAIAQLLPAETETIARALRAEAQACSGDGLAGAGETTRAQIEAATPVGQCASCEAPVSPGELYCRSCGPPSAEDYARADRLLPRVKAMMADARKAAEKYCTCPPGTAAYLHNPHRCSACALLRSPPVEARGEGEGTSG